MYQKLHRALGIFLPLLTVNCAILGGSLFMAERSYSFAESIVYGFGSGVGWALAIAALAAIRERLNYSDIPAGAARTRHSIRRQRADVNRLHCTSQDVMAMSEILLGSIFFSLIVLALTFLVLAARSVLAPQRERDHCRKRPTDRLRQRPGKSLLTALRDAGIAVPSTCAGVGTCGLCRVRVSKWEQSEPLPTETARIPRRPIFARARASPARSRSATAMNVEVPESLLSAERIRMHGCSKDASYLRSFANSFSPCRRITEFEFDAGAYVQITAPAYTLHFP